MTVSTGAFSQHQPLDSTRSETKSRQDYSLDLRYAQVYGMIDFIPSTLTHLGAFLLFAGSSLFPCIIALINTPLSLLRLSPPGSTVLLTHRADNTESWLTLFIRPTWDRCQMTWLVKKKNKTQDCLCLCWWSWTYSHSQPQFTLPGVKWWYILQYI